VSQLALNLLLALIWTLLAGRFTLQSLVLGFILGYLALALLRPAKSTEIYVKGLWGIAGLLGIYAYELFMASLQLARDILSNDSKIRGGFFMYDASALSPTKTVVLSNLLSLTPGTLTVDISDDGDHLYIHTVYANELEKSIESVRLYSDLILGIAQGGETPSMEDFDQWRPSSS
jgi:multicomponent Na+:H+ antiporter subunit E